MGYLFTDSYIDYIKNFRSRQARGEIFLNNPSCYLFIGKSHVFFMTTDHRPQTTLF